jgi:hypothetical protein
LARSKTHCLMIVVETEHQVWAFRQQSLQELSSAYVSLLPAKTESSETSTHGSHDFFLLPPSHRVVVWTRSESTKTGRQSSRVPQFSHNSVQLTAVFASPTLQSIQGLSVIMNTWYSWGHKLGGLWDKWESVWSMGWKAPYSQQGLLVHKEGSF